MNMMSRAVLFLALGLCLTSGVAAGSQAGQSPSPAAPAAEQTQGAPAAPVGAKAAPPPAASPPVANEPAPAASPASSAPADSRPLPNAPIPGTVAVDPSTYHQGPQAVLQVSVWGEPELSGPLTVRPDGIITLPIIKEVKAAGLTLVELGQVITDRLAKEAIRDPIVSVGLIAAHSRKYYLYGQVKSPGEKDLIMPTTVLQALVAADGFLDFANTKDIILNRNGKVLVHFNFKDAIQGKHAEKNVLLEPGDIIWVK